MTSCTPPTLLVRSVTGLLASKYNPYIPPHSNADSPCSAKILPLAAEVIENFLIQGGSDTVKRAVEKNYRKRLISNDTWLKTTAESLDPANRLLMSSVMQVG